VVGLFILEENKEVQSKILANICKKIQSTNENASTLLISKKKTISIPINQGIKRSHPQSRKSRDVELLLPHENCIARLLAQTRRETEKISCLAMLMKWNNKHVIEEKNGGCAR